MSQQVKLFVFVRVVGFLKYGYIIRAAFVEISVFLRIDRIDFKPDHAEIVPRQFAGFSYVSHMALGPAFAGKDEDFLHAAVGDDFHLFFNLFHGKLHPVNVVITVKSAVDAVIFTVIGYVERREQIYCVAEMAACFKPCPLCRLFKKGLCRRGKQGFEILNGTGLMLQSRRHIVCRIF